MRFLKVFYVLIIMSSSAYSWAQVNYQISITEPAHHLAQVRAEFQVTEAKPLTLMLPAWRSGKYQILDLANGVRLFQARDQKGQLLAVRKTEKSSWELTVPVAGEIQISYQIYANQLADRSRHIDETHAYINPSAYLMFSDESRHQPPAVSTASSATTLAPT